MNREQLREIMHRLFVKGYGWEKIKYSDDLYNATEEEIDLCYEFYEELQKHGTEEFLIND